VNSEAVRSHQHAEHRLNVLDRANTALRVVTAGLVVVLLVAVVWLGIKVDDQSSALSRQDCIAHVNGLFFSHLADALAKQPASVNRQAFLDRMKTDAASLTHLDDTCPK
jgi:hypothetical protein